MKTGGWVMIVVTWGIILFMFVFSFVKILKEHNSSRGGCGRVVRDVTEHWTV